MVNELTNVASPTDALWGFLGSREVALAWRKPHMWLAATWVVHIFFRQMDNSCAYMSLGCWVQHWVLLGRWGVILLP